MVVACSYNLNLEQLAPIDLCLYTHSMQKNGPWQIKSSEIKYQNPWIIVREDKVVRPDGKDGIFGVVEMVAGVSVLPIDGEGNVYLTEEFRYGIRRKSIEAISGGVDQNESNMEAAQRELEEEAGLRAKDWVDLGIVNPFTSVVVSSQHLYVARTLSRVVAHPEGTEQICILKMPLAEALRITKNGKITHGPTCVLLLKAASFLSTKP